MISLPSVYGFHSFLKSIAVLLCISCISSTAVLSKGNMISGQIANYTGNQAFLAMLYGGNQYAVDTASVTNGAFVFQSHYNLQSGVYLVILPPSHSFLILIDQDHPVYSFQGDVKNINNTLAFSGSPDNTEYYNYIRFFESKRLMLEQIKKSYESKTDQQDRAELLSNMQVLKNEIVEYQRDIVKRVPGSLTAAMVKCEIPVEVPSFDGAPEEINLKKFLYQKDHFFDNIELSDERLIRAPKNVVVDRVEYYLDVMTPQAPDSIIASVDEVLRRSEKSSAAYRFLLTHIFNKYRESKSIGMDAIFVHIAEQYIAKGKTPWIEEKEKNDVLTAVGKISPTLIGKQAPNFTVQREDGTAVSLTDIQSPYTVLFFWAPNCSHCQESLPGLTQFYDSYKSKGVEVFAVCTKTNEQEKNCWEYVAKNQLRNWINASDKGGLSNLDAVYNIRTTPKIYVLDKDKMIIAKDLSVDHLDEVMHRLEVTGNQ